MEHHCESQIADRVKGSAKLLELLNKHHGADIPAPIKEEEPEQPATIDPEPAVCPHCQTVLRAEGIPRVHDIKRAISRYFKLYVTDLDSDRRTGKVVYPRHLAMYLARTLTTRSLPEIGRYIGGRDHTTVLHGVRKIERLALSDWKVAYDIAHVEQML